MTRLLASSRAAAAHPCRDSGQARRVALTSRERLILSRPRAIRWPTEADHLPTTRSRVSWRPNRDAVLGRCSWAGQNSSSLREASEQETGDCPAGLDTPMSHGLRPKHPPGHPAMIPKPDPIFMISVCRNAAWHTVPINSTINFLSTLNSCQLVPINSVNYQEGSVASWQRPSGY